MTHLLSDFPLRGVRLFEFAAYLTAGIALGVLYFSNLWWTVRLFARGGRTLTMIALTIGRFVLLGAVLALASLEGAIPLLLITLGFLGGRFLVMRRLRERAS